MGGSSEEPSYLPDWGIETDWVLVCSDGKELPCCGAVLACLSPVLAGLRETKPRVDGLTPVPFNFSSALGSTFLYWAHRCRFAKNLEFKEAQALALVSHEWDIKELAICCDTELAKYAAALWIPKADQKRKQEVFELLDLAAKCRLAETLAACERAVIQDFSEVACDARLFKLDITIQRRILRGVGQLVDQYWDISCSNCYISKRESYGPSVKELRAWAGEMEQQE